MGEAAGEVTGWGARPAGEDPGVVDAPTGDPEVDQLVEEIEITRVEMTGTVEEIGDRLDPRNIVAGAKATVRDATVGKVEEMASNVGQTAQEAGTGIVETIKRNPVPAAMAAIGIGWLAMSARSSSSGAGRSGYGGYSGGPYGSGYGAYGYGGGSGYGGAGGHGGSTGQPGGAWETDRMGSSGGQNPVQQAGQRAGEAMSQAGQRASETVSNVQQSAGEAVSQVQQRAGQLAENVGRTAEQVPQQVGYTTREVTYRVGQMVQQNPLAAGAMAVAVGTAVGLALPVTPVERKVMTGPAGQALQKVESAAADALGQAEDKAREVEQQAREEERSSLS